MFRILRWIITGDIHLHNWKKVKEIDVYGNGAKSSMPTSTIWVLQCTVCGNIKEKKIG